VDSTLAEASQGMYVFYYFVVVSHLVVTTWLTLSMLVRSLCCPYDRRHYE